tara:strand:- start:231 stop:734 length:504 start_codon:yes stop_codon:yes gene_type:complete
MSARVSLNLPKSLWTAKDSLQLASNTVASIKIRTGKGLDADEQDFKDYSTNPIYVSKKGARLSPKGGRPSRTGRSVYYAKGYKEYKDKSRRRGGAGNSAEVDLVLSGNMLNNFVVKEATDSGFTIGLTKNAQYGYYVNEEREFIGLSDREVDILARAVEIDLRRKIK